MGSQEISLTSDYKLASLLLEDLTRVLTILTGDLFLIVFH
jgi:hypothetical protein